MRCLGWLHHSDFHCFWKGFFSFAHYFRTSNFVEEYFDCLDSFKSLNLKVDQNLFDKLFFAHHLKSPDYLTWSAEAVFWWQKIYTYYHWRKDYHSARELSVVLGFKDDKFRSGRIHYFFSSKVLKYAGIQRNLAMLIFDWQKAKLLLNF